MKRFIWTLLCVGACAGARVAAEDAGLEAGNEVPVVGGAADEGPVQCARWMRVRLDGGVELVAPLPCRKTDLSRDLGDPQP